MRSLIVRWGPSSITGSRLVDRESEEDARSNGGSRPR